MLSKVPWIPHGEMVDARGIAGLVLMREGGSLRPFPPQKRGGLDVYILQRGACPATLKVSF